MNKSKTIYLAIISIVTRICVIGGTIYFMNNSQSFAAGEDIAGSGTKDIKESTTLDPFTKIDIDADVLEIEVELGDDYAMDYEGTSNQTMTYKVENGKFILTAKKNKDFSAIQVTNATLKLTVPEGVVIENADIQTDVGKITLRNLEFDYCKAESDVGELKADGVKFREAILDTDTGDVLVDNSSFEKLEVSTDVGDIDVNSSTELTNYTFDLKNDVGDLEINGEEHGHKYNVKGDAGRIKLHGDVGDISVNY